MPLETPRAIAETASSGAGRSERTASTTAFASVQRHCVQYVTNGNVRSEVDRADVRGGSEETARGETQFVELTFGRREDHPRCPGTTRRSHDSCERSEDAPERRRDEMLVRHAEAPFGPRVAHDAEQRHGDVEAKHLRREQDREALERRVRGLDVVFNWDLVRGILGNDPGTSASAASRAVYTLVGLAGIGLALLAPRRRVEPRTLSESVSRA